MTVKADVDVGSFREKVMQIKSDRELRKKSLISNVNFKGWKII